MADPYLFRVDFEDRGADYKFTKPVRVRMFGELLISSGEEGISWRDVLVKVAARCYQIRPDIFLDDARAASLGVGGYADSRKMVGPRQFADGLYIEANKSAYDVVRILRKMLSLCRVPYDEVEITYRAGESASSAHRVPAPRHETPKPPSALEPRETAAFQSAAISRENPLPVREDFAAQNTPAPSSVTRAVDFEDDKADYSRAKPLSVKMFGAPLENFLPEEMTGEIATWTDVLVKTAAALYRQYPDTFRSKWFFANQTAFGVGDYGKSRAMRTPMRIAGGVFIETHLGDSEKVSAIRQLLDLCHVSYQNVEILYSLENAPPETPAQTAVLPRENPLPVREDFAAQNSPASSSVTRVVNFYDRGADYSRAEPVRVRMFGAPLENFLPDWQDCSIHSWADVLTKVAAVLYRKYRDAFRSLRFYQNQVAYGIGNAKEARQMKMQAPKSIAGGVYIETYSDTNAKIARIRSLLDLCGVSYDNVEIVYRVPKVSPVSNRAALPVREKPGIQNTPRDTLTVDFEDERADYSFTKPVRVRLFGAPLSDSLPDWPDDSVDTWTDVLYKTAAALYLRFPAAFSSQRFYRVQSSLHIGDADDAQRMRSPKKISADLYIDTYLNANNKIGQLKRLLWVCGVDSGALEIEYVRREGASSEPEKPVPTRAQMSPSETRVRDAFYTYLVRDAGLSNNTATQYLSAVRTAENIARERGLNPCSLLNGDREVILATVRALNQDPWFSTYNSDQHNRFSSAINYLLEFSRGYCKPAPEPQKTYIPEQPEPVYHRETAEPEVSRPEPEKPAPEPQKTYIPEQPEPVYHRETAEPEVSRPEPEKPAPEPQKTYIPEQPEPVSHRETAEPEVSRPEPEKPAPEPQKPFEPGVKPIRQALPSEASRERMRQAFSDYLLNDARLAPPTVRQYVKYVGEAEVYAREHDYSSIALYTEDREGILATVREFLGDPAFKRYDEDHHGFYSAAINQFLRFARGYFEPAPEPTVPEKTVPEAPVPEPQKPEPEKPASEPPKSSEPEPAPVGENLSNTVTNAEVSEPQKAPAKPRRGFGEMLGSLLKFKRRDKSRDALNEQPAPEPPAPAKPTSAAPVSETPAPAAPVSEKARPEGEVDIAVLERMYPKLKEELLAEMRREMAAKSPEPATSAEPVKPVETAKPAPEPTKPVEPAEPAEPAREGFLIVPARPDEPRLLCETVGRKITTLNFGLTFRLADPFPARDADFTLIFLDEEYRALTKPARVLLRAGESQRVSFRLPARAQQLRICYLGVRSASDSEKTLSQLMPFPVSIVFAAADFED